MLPGDIMLTVLSFLVIMTILVVIHEFGHYLPARYFKIPMETFSIGMGKELFGYTDKLGTRWKFSQIPFGGYVKYKHTDESEKNDKDSAYNLMNRPLYERFCVIIGGPLFNYISAILLSTLLFSTIGKQTLMPIVGSVSDGSIAHKIGISSGDIIKEINGIKIKSFFDIKDSSEKGFGSSVSVLVERKEREISLKTDITSKTKVLGISPRGDCFYENSTGIISSFCDSLKLAGNHLVANSVGIFKMITGQAPLDKISGPIGIVKMSGAAAKNGFYSVLFFMVALSMSLGFMNLLPLPTLDGGHLLFQLIEKILGRPVNIETQEKAFKVGFFVLIGLTVLVTFKDLALFKSSGQS
jgi:regulator of sigma E protease